MSYAKQYVTSRYIRTHAYMFSQNIYTYVYTHAYTHMHACIYIIITKFSCVCMCLDKYIITSANHKQISHYPNINTVLFAKLIKISQYHTQLNSTACTK